MSATLAAERPERPAAAAEPRSVSQILADLAKDLLAGSASHYDSSRRQVRTPQALYAVYGRPVLLDDGTVTAVVLIERRDPDPPPAYEIRSAFPLTRRETEVARLIARGHSNSGIAVELSISPHTARHHTGSVLRKLEVSSRDHVARRLWGVRTRRKQRRNTPP